jgi:hypothetical protein
MCLFSQPIRHVSRTRILARPLEHGRQLLIYAMSLSAEHDLAMVLPIPVPPSAPEDAVRFVDLSSCPDFFDRIDALFPAELSRGLAAEQFLELAPQPRTLAVHDVGDFEASFVPSRADFDRLDPRFRLPGKVWDALTGYRDWGYCVFKLKVVTPPSAPAPAPPPPAPGFLERALGLFSRSASSPARAASPSRDYHPMAFEFPLRDPSLLFFPTVHVHDGAVHETARFDHSLYCQSANLDADWERSPSPAGDVTGKARAWIDPNAHLHRRRMSGELPNHDVFVSGALSGAPGAQAR